MRIAEHMIRAKHVAPTERFGSSFQEILAHLLFSVGDDKPRLWHTICWIVCPAWALQLVAFGEIFRCACAECCPAALLFCRILWHLDRTVNETLTTIDVIQKECIHEIAHSHTKPLLA